MGGTTSSQEYVLDVRNVDVKSYIQSINNFEQKYKIYKQSTKAPIFGHKYATAARDKKETQWRQPYDKKQDEATDSIKEDIYKHLTNVHAMQVCKFYIQDVLIYFDMLRNNIQSFAPKEKYEELKVKITTYQTKFESIAHEAIHDKKFQSQKITHPQDWIIVLQNLNMLQELNSLK